MPTPKASDIPTPIQIGQLEQLVFAEHHQLLVHPATFGYRKRVGLARRGWIATSYRPRKNVKIDANNNGPAIVLTDLGRKVARTFTRDPRVQEILGQQRLDGF